MRKDSRIFVAGHRGLVGSAICRRLRALGYRNLITVRRDAVDLCKQGQVDRFFRHTRPEFVFLAAAKVGGIMANKNFPADFIRDNLLIQTLVVDACWRFGVRKLQMLGSSCIYPRETAQPIREDQLLTGTLEPSNAPYAIAKIAGIKMGEAYRRQYGLSVISLMPTNLYGPGDNFHPEDSHVIPGLIGKMQQAKREGREALQLWGTGRPRREFLHVDDLASACELTMRLYDDSEPLNVGYGGDITIRELAETIREVVGYAGGIRWDLERPDGTLRKLLDSSRIRALGWKPQIDLRSGLRETYGWYLKQTQLQAA
ncbi:MAG: GDP-L-fucose synthase family protein [Planctomycetota bacterium]